MKRVITILLTLLLLLPMIGCKAFETTAAKNYTVKEVDGEKRIFLDPNEVPRIWSELQDKGYSITPLKGFSEKDMNQTASLIYPDAPSDWESSVFIDADLIVKCSPVGAAEVYRIDAASSDEYLGFYGEVYTLKVEKVFYCEDSIKVGDTIRVLYNRWTVGDRYHSLGELTSSSGIINGVKLNDRTIMDVPAKNKSMYVFLSTYPILDVSYTEYNFSKLADYTSYYGGPPIIEVKSGTYQMHSLYKSLTDGAEVIPEAERSSGLDRILKCVDFDDRFQNMVDKYNNVVRFSKRSASPAAEN